MGIRNESGAANRLRVAVSLYVLTLLRVAESAAAPPPLRLLQTIEIPDVPSGPYADHMAIDVQGLRLFTTPQAAGAVAVLDLRTLDVERMIGGFDNPHAILYRSGRERLFVTDGKGELAIIDAHDYRPVRSIPLQPGADGMAFDLRSGLLYVSNGGNEAGSAESRISIIDTELEARVGEIRVAAPTIEGMLVDSAADRLYVSLPESHSIGLVDLSNHRWLGTWRLKRASRDEALSLDPEHHVLFVGCNSGDVRGKLVVIDTRSGQELQQLPLGSWVDSMQYDARRSRLYASTGIGEVFTYERRQDGRLQMLPAVDTAVMARTSLFSPELDRLYVMVPHLGWTPAKVLVFQPQ